MGSNTKIGDFVGDDGKTYVTGTSKTSTLTGSGIYASHRWGEAFGLNIPLEAGKYDVVMHFMENWPPNCGKGKRVFDFTVGDKPTVKGYDAFAEAGGCDKPVTEKFTGVTVSKSLVVSFKAVEMNAFVAGISIVPAGTTAPSPEGGGGSTPSTPATPTTPTGETPPPPTGAPPPPVDTGDTGAHAVPPIYESSIVDINKDGKHTVQMDGTGSHTHTIVDGEFATLKSLVWKNLDTEKVLCSGPDAFVCTVTFELGSHMIELCVTDTTSSKNCAETTVTIVESVTNGVYCYYYNLAGETGTAVPLKMGLEADAGASPKPLFGAASTAPKFSSATAFPSFPFKSGTWGQRCVFFFDAPKVDTYEFTIKHIGGVKLFVGEEQILSAPASTSAKTTTGKVEIPEGLQQVDVVYLKTGSNAQMELGFNATEVLFKYDTATLLPIITSISPKGSGLGGAFVKVNGLNIDGETQVLFGGKKGLSPLYAPSKSVSLTSPKVTSAGNVDVILSNQAGTSNAVTYTYSGGGSDDPADDPLAFTSTQVPSFTPGTPTNIAMGPDFKYYMTTTKGEVIVVDLDHINNYAVKSTCTSAPFTDSKWINSNTKGPAQRWALGITFNPKDTGVKAYISTSSLFWSSYLKQDFNWANGNVEVVVPGGGCMQRQSFLITGLPVSNHDHSVNSMVFDQGGDLHLQVGGFTNQGIPGVKLGNFDENPLSGASLVAATSKGGSFNGKITYSGTKPETAKKTGGDVSLYATGLRNSYGITLHSNGKFYATDNGPNNSFGERSVTCTTKLPDKGQQDKIVQLKKGKYYGHPNRNRGQCTFIDINGKTPDGGNPPGSLNFDSKLAAVQSSTNGIMEYTANTFQGKLRGDLFASKFASQSGNGVVWRMQLDSGGGLADGPDNFFNLPSGLAVVQGHRGELIFPRVQQNKVIVAVPKYATPTDLRFLAVTPFRGGKGGGKVVLITGHNFVPGETSATIGNKPCTKVSAVTATSFKCTTPAGTGLVDVSVTVSGATVTAPSAFWYMNI